MRCPSCGARELPPASMPCPTLERALARLKEAAVHAYGVYGRMVPVDDATRILTEALATQESAPAVGPLHGAVAVIRAWLEHPETPEVEHPFAVQDAAHGCGAIEQSRAYELESAAPAREVPPVDDEMERKIRAEFEVRRLAGWSAKYDEDVGVLLSHLDAARAERDTQAALAEQRLRDRATSVQNLSAVVRDLEAECARLRAERCSTCCAMPEVKARVRRAIDALREVAQTEGS